jgi:FKBP-type peptidyl-prolyl cis-trans isomerases 2
MVKKVNSITQIFRGPIVVLLLLLIFVTSFSGCLASGEKAKEGDTVFVYYNVTLDDGTDFESNIGGQPFKVVLGQHEVIPGFEKALYGVKVNQTKKFVIKPEEAYGVHNPDLVVSYSKEYIVDGLGYVPNVGETLDHSNGVQTFRGIVKEVTDTTIVIDFNREYAGRRLNFNLTVAEIQKSEAS